ncbi:chloride channel protein [Pseudoroseicyclus tamaricis]|uniref:Chloride channel protein n=1 Tax=Pseudoroseicyclus tamaricis TaxID=2705421 RepID=A0A6B2K1S1_9RHOB|nr:chloride channel protein [Pseudoroseicyclus tamaricis]NDV01702.1 chloride channel protein [Pseudoroseicyclus tamaricis]
MEQGQGGRTAWMRAQARRGGVRLRLWALALAIGLAASVAALAFRLGIAGLQALFYGTDDVAHIHSFAAGLDWYWLLVIPILGGLAVGLLLDRLTEDGRVRSVADVIEAAALRDGRVQRRRGLVSALASLITLSTGGSTGREGPVVHLAAVLASYVNSWAKLGGIEGRELLGCAVAAAVSASFNAPIAGALFAMEVVLRHFAVQAFAPIVIASAAGTVAGRLVFGDITEFQLPFQNAVEFYVELPAFLLLGIVCGGVAVVQMRAIFWADSLAGSLRERVRLPGWAWPMLAGAILGAIAIPFPHIIGVGYETTSRALTGELLFREAVIFAIVKVAAVSVTMGGRMGGGIFSPSLMVGSLTGLAFGLVATHLAPELSGGSSLYALAGMGAVAAAVLGAPISTILIVFELTGDWQAGLAVMVSVALSSAVASALVDRSFFLTQLERRGVHLAAGPQAWLLGTFRVESVMRAQGHPRGADEAAMRELIAGGTFLKEGQTLEEAMPMFETAGASVLPVVHFAGGDAGPELRGALFHVDALRALNRALARRSAEAHG